MEIKIYTLGRFSIVNEKNPIQFHLKARSKPILVLKALIAFGGFNVKKEKISDALWPDADGDMANKALTTNLHRLRKMLNIDKAITLSGGTMTLNPKTCWTDVSEFERQCIESDSIWSHSTDKNILETIQITMRAVSLYKGPFLPDDIELPWTVFLRERLKFKYLRAIGKIGHYYEESGMTEKAVEYFERSLQTDYLDEECYRRLMACYYRIGKRSKALAVYSNCKRVLLEALGIEPSRETEILRNSIMMSEK